MIEKKELLRGLRVLVAAIGIVLGVALIEHVTEEDGIAFAREKGNVLLMPMQERSLLLTPLTEPENQKALLFDMITEESLWTVLHEEGLTSLHSSEWVKATAERGEYEVLRIWYATESEAKYAKRDEMLGMQAAEAYAEIEKRLREEREAQAAEEKLKTNAAAKGLIYKRNTAYRMDLSKKEYECLLRIVQAEAGDEPVEGKILVANVVLNRVLSQGFPNTVTGVVFQEKQFSPVRNGSYYRVKVSDATIRAVNRALEGEDYSQGALYFFARKWTSKANAKWFDTCLEKVLKFGGHEFYR